ncbi:hypothetical protein [Streptomyces sp. NPDC048282]|uniref:hypothetical protein n=1 Tax=Streptomyces sp. NPDC048282 TaxID=3365528 RepID=UPI00371C1F11
MTRHDRGFVRYIALDSPVGVDRYPFSLPVVTHLAGMDRLDLDPAVTFLVGPIVAAYVRLGHSPQQARAGATLLVSGLRGLCQDRW